MDQTSIFTNRGAPVSVDAINEDLIDDMSLGELAYACALFSQKFSGRLSQPDAENEVSLYRKASGSDWSGFASQNKSRNDEETTADEPIAPDNYVDTLPAITSLMAQHDRANDAAMTNLTRLLQIAQKDQAAYMGVPEGVRGFRDVSEIMRTQLRMSGHRAKRLQVRAKYVSHAVEADRTAAGAEPKLPNIAASYASGNIPGESLDRIAAFDEDLTKYSAAVGRPLDYKDQVIQAFEPTLLEAAESASPEELSQARRRWTEQVVHHIDADGPPPTEALKKKPDNALHLRSHDDGSATASMHMDPAWAAVLKEFLNTNLNYKGNKPLLPENIENLYEAMADAKTSQDTPNAKSRQCAEESQTEGSQPQQESPTREEKLAAFHEMLGSQPDIDDRVPSQIEASLPQPFSADTVIAEDERGNEYTRQQVDWIDKLTRPQRAGAILLGAIYSVMSMHPDEAAARRAHGAPAKLVIVQDIQTAHVTLGLPALPQAVQRPPGPTGILPPIIRRPNPNDHNPSGPAPGAENEFTGYANPVPWTPYQSEAVNIGPMHPGHLGPTLCDAELVGQIWNGRDIVLNEYRSKRLFTTAQRKAILGRDKGCQAPGCIVQATYCQCHHIEEWSENGETNENNSITLCPAHHPDVHDGKWTIRKINGVTYFQPAKWLDPDQPLLRNLYWNA